MHNAYQKYNCISCDREVYEDDLATCDKCGEAGCEKCITYYERTDMRLCTACREDVQFVLENIALTDITKHKGEPFMYVLESKEQLEDGPSLIFRCEGLPKVRVTILVDEREK